MMNIVALAAETGIDWGERAATAGVTTLLGMVTIFSVLALLWATIEIMHYLLHRGEAKKKEPKNASTPAQPSAAPSVDDAAIAAAIAASLAACEGDSATVAAIVAAITAMRAEEGESGGFRVVSFKRVGKNAPRRGF